MADTENNMAAERNAAFAITNIYGHKSQCNMAATRHATSTITRPHGLTPPPPYTEVTIQNGRHNKQHGRRAKRQIHNHQYTPTYVTIQHGRRATRYVHHYPSTPCHTPTTLHLRHHTTWPTHKTTTWPPSVLIHSLLQIYTASHTPHPT
jgi:hypothetical protein